MEVIKNQIIVKSLTIVFAYTKKERQNESEKIGLLSLKNFKRGFSAFPDTINYGKVVK